MNNKINVWKFITSNLQSGLSTILLYVLESKGSSPGRQGFCMAVNERGIMQGSIGGGIMEHKLVEMAKDQLQNQQAETTIKKQIHDKSVAKNRSGMICSGEQTVLLYPVQPGDIDSINELINSLDANQNGSLKLSPEGLSFSTQPPNNNFTFSLLHEDDWLYEEKTGYHNKLYIIGGGHCSLALSRLMSTMDFYITVYDERESLNTLEQNEYAHEKHRVSNYSLLEDLIAAGDNTYVVIMTIGFRTDAIALKALLNKDFKYLGLMGSQKKIEILFNEFENEGYDKTKLSTIHSPIGLPIKSQTPEEIAISIAAEIIQVKNREL
ncbi:MAG: xanthine and dehydrogenase maturation factor XdhC/CoxF family-like protein [Segetibacter sp.]|nr:xanthine and dehydrogenase maturation factor XdhC/CoxF family-like protein [Segetibacter sp.]